MSKRKITVALAGNANVGKSVIFNQLTGLHQHIGNWPGKTVEKAEGTLYYKDYVIDIIDLPGIYSLSTYSLEELISRRYIAVEKPDVVVNVVDASALERNLFFTIQLMELEAPMVIALNQMDIARKKGILIDVGKLEELLGIPIVPTIAIKGVGLTQLLDKIIEVAEKGRKRCVEIKYGKEIEERIAKLTEMIKQINYHYPIRYTAIKLLEEDKEIVEEISKINPQIASFARNLATEIEEIHGHPCPSVMTSERYEKVTCIVREVQRITPPLKPSIEEMLHDLTTHRILGYPIMIITLLSIFYTVFIFGGYISELLNGIFYGFESSISGIFGVGVVGSLIWSIMEGVIAGVTIAIPYIAPFYVILYMLEDSGYLCRIAFLMDSLMHRMGLHGKAFIPIILSYGCNVPACLGCRIMETEKERLLAVFVTTLIPCAARTVIILGLVGRFLGIEWVLALYVFDLIVIFLLGRLAFKALPGEPAALIMEMPTYRIPHLKTVLKQTFFRLTEFIKIAFPLIIAGSFIIKSMEVLGLLEIISTMLSPITVAWLGLPAITGITLIFGILRKELTLIMLSTLLGTMDFSIILTPTQMIVFTIVTMFYIPCISTIAALIKEVGWKNTLLITVFEIVFAITLGGVAFRILTLIIR